MCLGSKVTGPPGTAAQPEKGAFAEPAEEVRPEVSEEDLVALAYDIGADSEEYEHFMKTLTYVDQHGKRMTRAEFKSSIRVAAKAINFGIA